MPVNAFQANQGSQTNLLTDNTGGLAGTLIPVMKISTDPSGTFSSLWGGNLGTVGTVGTILGLGGTVPISGSLSAVIAPVSSDYYPMYNVQNLGKGQFSVDPAGALETHGAVTTDEGIGRANFTGTNIYTTPGTAQFTNGTTAVTGVGFSTTEMHFLDYIKLASDPETAWNQISFINTDTSITLFSNYTGASSTGNYQLSPVSTSTGTGGTISVASGALTIALGTNTSAATTVYRDSAQGLQNAVTFISDVSISQRIANQDIYIGLETAIRTTSPSQYFARFHATSTTNTSIITETGFNPIGAPTVSETESNTITLPGGANTSTINTYRIDMNADSVTFFINNVQVSQHKARIPHITSQPMQGNVRGINSGTVTNTNIVTNFLFTQNYDMVKAYAYNNYTNLGVNVNSGTIASATVIGGSIAVTAGTINTGTFVMTSGTLNVGTATTNQASGTLNLGTVNMTSGTLNVGTVTSTMTIGTVNTGTVNTGTINTGTINVATITAGSIVVTAGTFVNNGGSAIAYGPAAAAAASAGNPLNVGGTDSGGTIRTIKVDSGGLQRIGLDSGTISVLPNLPQGSINVTAGTVTATVTVGTVSAGTINTGTINTGTINAGTINTGTINVGTFVMPSGTLNVGTVTATVTTGTVNAGTINTGTLSPIPTIANVTYGTHGTTGVSIFGTLAGGTGSGAGTEIFITSLSLSIPSTGGSQDVSIGWGSNGGTFQAGTGLLVRGNFVAGGGIQKTFWPPVNSGTQAQLMYFQAGAGTVDISTTYFTTVSSL